jgi:hypothetical protein
MVSNGNKLRREKEKKKKEKKNYKLNFNLLVILKVTLYLKGLQKNSSDTSFYIREKKKKKKGEHSKMGEGSYDSLLPAPFLLPPCLSFFLPPS